MFTQSTSHLAQFEQRRRQLRMSYAQLAVLSGVSAPTLFRALSGKNANVSFANVVSLAKALGVSLEMQAIPAHQFLEQAAEKKADSLVGMVQGTSGLEAQAVDKEQLDAMKRQTVHELLAGSRRNLWG